MKNVWRIIWNSVVQLGFELDPLGPNSSLANTGLAPMPERQTTKLVVEAVADSTLTEGYRNLAGFQEPVDSIRSCPRLLEI